MDEWLLLQHGLMLYVALFFLLLGGAVGLPIPEDLPLIGAGILIERGEVKALTVFLVCYAGVVIGDVIIYFVGRRFGAALFKSKWFRSRVSSRRVKHTRLKLEKRSILMIFIARHLFYLRTVTFLTCGAVRMRVEKFLLADMAAALISLPIMMGIGYVASEHYQQLLEWFGKARNLSVIVILIAGAAYLQYRWRKYQLTQAEGEE